MESTTTPITINAVVPEKEVYKFTEEDNLEQNEHISCYKILHILNIVLSKKFVLVGSIMLSDINLLWLYIYFR